jgi:hypothetical protein
MNISKQDLLTPLTQLIDELNVTDVITSRVVWDDNDPAMLGRIRALPPKTDYEGYVLSIKPTFNEATDTWTKEDPLLFLPLLPFYISQVPKKGEYVHIIYYNTRKTDSNKFYIQGPFSDPRRTQLELYDSSVTYLSSGVRVKQNNTIKSKTEGFDTKERYKSKGIFPEPGDNAILGRGSADVVVKPKEVLIRAGKYNEINDISFPIGNNLRSFLQLSSFESRIVEGPLEEKTILKEIVKVVKKIIIWDIENIENVFDVFNGSVGIYNVIPNSTKVNTENFVSDSITNLSIGTDYQGPIEEFKFKAKSFQEIVTLINKVIRGVFDGYLQMTNYVINSQNNFTDAFPFIVTPSKITYQNGNSLKPPTTSIDAEIRKNYVKFYNAIKLDANSYEQGFMLVSENKNERAIYGPPMETKKITSQVYDYEPTNVTYGVLGAQKVYIISHDSEGPRGQLDITDTLYGIDQNRFVSDENSFESKTYSTVRGEEIIELLRKIVGFIAGHVHAISTVPPIPVTSGNGIDIGEINQMLADAENSILNQNIRIN